MSKDPFFTGPLAPMCESYVAQKRVSGLDYGQQAMLLRMFDNFCKNFEIQNYTITKEIALAWCKKRPNERDATRYSRVGEMQRFAQYLCNQGYPSYLLSALPKYGEQHVPYIFSVDELHRIFERLDALEPTNLSPNQHLTMPLLFRMLYGCGLRISETLTLLKSDVDLNDGTIHIQHGKNDSERIVPMSATLTEECRKYMCAVHKDTADSVPLFYTKERTYYSKSTIGKFFRGILWDVEIPYRGTQFGPRVHDLRHTFCCHNIQRWAEAGLPIYSNLLILSRYVGHTSLSSTQYYLRLTAQAFPHIMDICEKGFGGMYAPFDLIMESEGLQDD